MPADYVLKVLSPEQADALYLRKDSENAPVNQAQVFVDDVIPVDAGPYLWIDTSLPGKFTFWIEDGI